MRNEAQTRRSEKDATRPSHKPQGAQGCDGPQIEGAIRMRVRPTHSHTHPPTRSLAHSLIHPLTHSLAHSRTHSLTHSLTHSPTHALTHLCSEITTARSGPTIISPTVNSTASAIDSSACLQMSR